MLLFIASAASVASAQSAPPVDSLIAHYITKGAVSSWQPHTLYKGCPNLKGWQQQVIRRLMAAQLASERLNDLAQAWMIALKNCNDQQLEQWYFEHLSSAVRRGDGDQMFGFWFALRYADSRSIRDYLRGLMLEESVPMNIRDLASGILFLRLNPGESYARIPTRI